MEINARVYGDACVYEDAWVSFGLFKRGIEMKALGKPAPHKGDKFIAQQGVVDISEHYRKALLELADELDEWAYLAPQSKAIPLLAKKARISAGEKGD
jgi:hypothetical protein